MNYMDIEQKDGMVVMSARDFRKLVRAAVDVIDGKDDVDLIGMTGHSLKRCQEIQQVIGEAYEKCTGFKF